ncbi:hypothetical protein Tco_1436971 [Tanacetum coccineum]
MEGWEKLDVGGGARITLEEVPYLDTIRKGHINWCFHCYCSLSLFIDKKNHCYGRISWLLLKEQFDAVTSQIATLTLEIQTAKASRWTRHEAGSSDQWIPRSMRLDVPKFNGSDPDTRILAINEYFSLLETTPEQRLRIIGFNMEGDATEWYRWMTRNKLVTSWEGFLESVRNRFGSSKYDNP